MQYFYPEGQLLVALYFAVVGILLSLLNDIFKIKRIFFGTNTVVLFVDDLLYMFLCSIVVVVCILKINSGLVRWYEVLFSCVGFILYRLTVSRIIIRFFVFVSRLIKRMLKGCIELFLKLFKPLLLPLRKIYSIINNKLLQIYIAWVIEKNKRIMIRKIKAVSRKVKGK